MSHIPTTPSSVWQNPWHFIAFGFGSGLSPIAPGTCGSLVAILLYLPIAQLSLFFYSIVMLVLIVFGCWLCTRVSNELGVHDHSGIVIDEIAGFCLTMLLVKPTMINVFIGFTLFRIFDIVKPWPISWVDRNVQGGIGIMLDDVLAAIPAALLLFAWSYTLRLSFCGFVAR